LGQITTAKTVTPTSNFNYIYFSDKKSGPLYLYLMTTYLLPPMSS